MKRIVPILAVVGIAVAGTGCGKDKDRLQAHPVSGKVLYDGGPVAGVKVFFFPVSAPTIPEIPANPAGVTGPDGSFTLTTFKSGDGAPAGSYQVILLWTPDSADEETTTDQFLGWFDAVHSPLKAMVEPGDNSIPPFKIPKITHPPEAMEGIPGRN